MKRKLLFGALVFSLVIGACSFGAPRKQAQPTLPVAVQVQPTATQPVKPVNTQPAATNITVTPAATDTVAARTATPSASATPVVPSVPGEPVEIKGSFSFTNDIILTYYVEHAVAMVDLYGFVKRDKQWEIPVSSQVLGFMKIDADKKTGTFDLQLPAKPDGQIVNVNPSDPSQKGLEVFNLGYFPNLAGGPYSEGDDPSKGWLNYLASTTIDTENNDEVTGGKLVIWAPDDKQYFPSDFGADGLLFTRDDPVQPVLAGYSIVDLDQKPFKLIRETMPEMTLYEPKDAAVKDFSSMSYQEAFDKMFAMVRKEYAFNGIQGKQPDWDKLYAELSPRIQDASQKKDATAFYQVLRGFTLAFKDGHVSVDGGKIGTEILQKQIAGGYGFAIRELDNGQVLAVFVLKGGPAEKAGMKVGAEITQFNGEPIKDAIGKVEPLTAPFSTDFSKRYEQARFLLRAPLDTKASVTYTNPGGTPQTVDLTTVEERDSLSATSSFRGFDPNALPVEYVVAQNSIGYTKINSNYDDLNLIVRLFQRALDTFKKNEIKNLIIDMRQNSGGANLGLAGFLTNQEITLGQLEYYSDKTGKFESEGDPEKVTPMVEQFTFKKMFLLVDQACASACELEAYGFSKVPGMVVVGEHPTSGTEAEVSRGQFKMPEGMSLQIPTGRFILPDGSLFLEGKGVQPTERIPVDAETVMSTGDPVISKVFDLIGK